MDQVELVFSLCQAIYGMVENMKANKQRCLRVAQRVKSLEGLLLTIKNRKTKISPTVEEALKELSITLISAKELMVKFSGTKTLKAFLKSGSHEEKFREVNEKLSDSFQVLSGALQIEHGAILHRVYESVARPEYEQSLPDSTAPMSPPTPTTEMPLPTPTAPMYLPMPSMETSPPPPTNPMYLPMPATPMSPTMSTTPMSLTMSTTPMSPTMSTAPMSPTMSTTPMSPTMSTTPMSPTMSTTPMSPTMPTAPFAPTMPMSNPPAPLPVSMPVYQSPTPTPVRYIMSPRQVCVPVRQVISPMQVYNPVTTRPLIRAVNISPTAAPVARVALVASAAPVPFSPQNTYVNGFLR